ncbi:MAG: hypothetical protein FJ317_04665, partial [SAR202 cluster bacterium]|nr:hypothetical protein [SAR202 cluster bacterium]
MTAAFFAPYHRIKRSDNPWPCARPNRRSQGLTAVHRGGWRAILARRIQTTGCGLGKTADSSKAHVALPAVSARERKQLLTAQLKGVSRAFYLTLRVLPKSLREPIGLAYLLARAADTIADTRFAAPDRRLALLRTFREQVAGPASQSALDDIEAAMRDTLTMPGERALLLSMPGAFGMLESLPEGDGLLVRRVVTTLTEGMEFDLMRFPPENAGTVHALETGEELDRYTYLVAGCVGEFWTETAFAHTPALSHWDVPRMSEAGVRFGKALQMTNILRDVPSDARNGRCYLPMSALSDAGLSPVQL